MTEFDGSGKIRKPLRRFEKEFSDEQEQSADLPASDQPAELTQRPGIYTDITSDTSCQGTRANIEKALNPKRVQKKNSPGQKSDSEEKKQPDRGSRNNKQ